MDVVTKLETYAKQTTNQKLGKDLRLLIAHVKLLHKYTEATDGTLLMHRLVGNFSAISELEIIQTLLGSVLPTYKEMVDSEYRIVCIHPIWGKDVQRFLEHASDLIEISLTGEEEISEGNVFLGIEEKIKRAQKSAREGNAEGLFSNLHTIFELLLKDKLGIALDMDSARLGKVVGICIKHEVFLGKNNILSQLNRNVCNVDNNMKHNGYNPMPKEINDALLITTQAIRVLKNEMPIINDKVKGEISEILIKNN